LALPDLSGDQLATRALNQQRGLLVVFASGYEALPPSAEGFGGTALLQKPYDERSLAETLSAVIEASLA
jgi:FixJ family two-component response regulator